MDRNKASALLREELNKYGLNTWKVRLTSDPNVPYLGLCSFKDKAIILNAHHCDIHDDDNIIDTIKHEVAHALVGVGHGHDEVWKAKAKELGCNGLPCSHLGLPAHILDAIRSGATVEMTVEEETIVIKTPKYTVTRLQDNCEICGKVAVEKSSFEILNPATGNMEKWITLECFHVFKKVIPRGTPFHELVSNSWKPEIAKCKHIWGDNIETPQTQCVECGEFKLFDFQIKSAQFNEAGLALQKGVLNAHEMGLGKVQSVDTPILTPNGWKRNGDLQLGDLVIASDGKPYSITGLYPQGVIDLYKVIFSDGSSTNCGDEHLWIVNTAIRNNRGNPYQIKAWKDLKDNLKTNAINSTGKFNNKWYIPITNLVEFSPREIKINPYLMGLILGDGSFRGHYISFSSADKELIDFVNWKHQSKYDYECRDKELANKFFSYNLGDTDSFTKFIPEDYLYNEIWVRSEILKGLMDTDGSIWENGVVEYTTISMKLALGVMHLVQSLGGIVRLTSKAEPKYTYKGQILIGQKCYRLVINIPNNPFKLLRKADKWELFQEKKKYKPTRAIIGYEYIGKQEGQCISINSPDKSYLTEDFIVTHNTVIALSVIKYHPELTPTLYVVKSKTKFQWLKEIMRWIGPSHLGLIISTSKDTLIPGFKSYIISYDLMRRMNRDDIKTLGIKLVILDECQQIKNVDSGRTQQIRRIVADETIKIIALSGTPWKNRGEELFPIMNMISPTKFHSQQKFLTDWVDWYMQAGNRKQGGIRNIPRFKEYTKDLIIRYEYDEVMADAPAVKRMKLPVQLDEIAQEQYEDATSDFVDWYNQHLIDGTEDSIQGIELLAQMARMRHITGLAKIAATIEFCDEFYENTDRSLVIFVHHKDVAYHLVQELKKLFHDKPDVIIDTLSSDKDDIGNNATATRFGTSNKRWFVVAGTLSCGEGIDGLQKGWDSILHERQWNPQNEDQATPGRFKRIGQKSKTVNITCVEADETIDQDLDVIVERKRKMFHELHNKGEVPKWDEGEIGREVAKRIVERFKKKGKTVKNKNIKGLSKPIKQNSIQSVLGI